MVWVGGELGACSGFNKGMDANHLFTAALGLQSPWEVKSLDFNVSEKRLDIRVDFQKGASFPCPLCGSPSKAHDTEERTWRHLDFFQHSAYLTARVPRCNCDEHGIKTVDVPWARKGSGFTLMFEALVMVLVREMPVNAVARLVGEHDTRIWRVLDYHVKEARARQDFSEVKTICIDEKSYRRGHRYVTFVMDLAVRRLLFGTVGRDGDTVAAFVKDLKAHNGSEEHIQDVCCDLSPAFIKGIREHLPKAEITFDRFHLMKLMNEALDAVRREESPSTPGLKKTRYHWLKNPGDLTLTQKTRLRDLKAMNLQTVEAYQMKLLFQDFFEQANPRAAQVFLSDWCTLAHASEIKPLMKLADTLRSHERGILNWWRSGISNGLIEGMNSLIQAAIAKARGYRNPKNLITIAYLLAGKLDFNNVLTPAALPT
jgi:transposase